MIEFFQNFWVWLVITIVCLAACTWFPIKIKNDLLRQQINWFLLIPISIVIVAYVYPVGIEFFRQIAVDIF